MFCITFNTRHCFLGWGTHVPLSLSGNFTVLFVGKFIEEILQQTGQKRGLLKKVMNGQLQFLGHVMRKQKFEHVVICGKI